MNKIDSTHVAFVPKGDSMWPNLKNKKQTVIIDKSKTDIYEYDVVLYSRANGDSILHRVIKIHEGGDLICSGDSQFVLEKVSRCQVEGVMIGYYKKDKYRQVDQKYRDKCKKYYNSKRRKFKVKTYFFCKRVVNKIKRIFKGK